MIEINNLTAVRIDEEFLGKVAKKVLEGEKKEEANLSIALVGQGRMRELNKRYRGKNKVTDVLAFNENKIPISQFLIPKSIKGLGEVIICLREVKKNAKRYKSTFKKELAQVLIHGTLHLLGYDHEKLEKEAKEMEEKQGHYFKLCQNLIS